MLKQALVSKKKEKTDQETEIKNLKYIDTQKKTIVIYAEK